MATSPRRSFSRPLGERRYKKLYLIASEGHVSEPEYFQMFEKGQTSIHIKMLSKEKDSSPKDVLKRMTEALRNEALRKEDEAWCVIDKDNWSEAQFEDLYQWTTKDPRRHLAMSNPNFELWLLFHFEQGHGVTTARDVQDRLKRHLPEYNKHIDSTRFDPLVCKAIQNARQKDQPPCTKWPQSAGSTVYRLAEHLLESLNCG